MRRLLLLTYNGSLGLSEKGVCSIADTWSLANEILRSDTQSQSPIIFPPGINQEQRTLGLLGHQREGCGAPLGSHREF